MRKTLTNIKKWYAILFILSFHQISFGQIYEPQIVVNEIYSGSLKSDNAFIELLVIGNNDPCGIIHNIEIVKLIIDDSNTSAKMQPGHLAIKPECLSGVQMGDLILIHGKNANIKGTKAKFRFQIDDICIEKWGQYPNSKDNNYKEVIPIYSKKVALSDFIGFGKGNQELQLRNEKGKIQSVELTGQKKYSLASGVYDNYKELQMSPMAANNEANGNLIKALIATNNQFKIKTRVFDAGNNSKPIINDVELKICNGIEPFHVVTTNYDMPFVIDRTLIIHDLPCGTHTITVTDSEGEIRTKTVSISPTECVFISACPGEEITLPVLECMNLSDTCYAWFPEELFSNQPNGNKTLQPTITVPDQPGTLELELFVSNNNGNISGAFEVTIEITEDNDGDGLCGANDPDDNDVCVPLGYLNLTISDPTGNDPEIMCSNDSKVLSVNLGDSWIWNTGETTQSITINGLGGYSVTATDIDGCEGEAQIFVNEYTTPEITIFDEYILCNSEEYATVVVDGPEAYTYLWSNGYEGQSIQVDEVGTYTVTVSNSGICETVFSTEVIESEGEDCCNTTPPFSISYDGSYEVCTGGTTTLIITLEGGSPPYELFHDPNVVENVTEISLGVYEVDISQTYSTAIYGIDAFYCFSEVGFQELEITEVTGPDSDGDGICDPLDPNPNDPCVPYLDDDGDGVCDGVDCDPDDVRVGQGLSCWDYNSCTYNDVYDENCNCVGTPIPDCECNYGDPCDDQNPCTENDVIVNQTCGCVGTEILGCVECEQGTPCDDQNDCTVNDTFNEYCECIGEDVSEDGLACDDGDDCTTDDIYSNCECEGTPIVVNITPCDDGSDCTVNDHYNEDCECVGDRIVLFTIIEDLTPCENGSGTLTVAEQYNEYEWRLDGVTISNDQSCQVIGPGLYQIFVVDAAGCYDKRYHEVVDFENSNVAIQSTENSICNASNPVELSISTNWTGPIQWYNEFDVDLGQSHTQLISQEGKYRVEITDENGCQRFGEITIDQESLPEVKIVATDPDVCGDQFTLEIEEYPDADIAWTGPSGFTNPEPYILEGVQSGIYTVTVTYQGENSVCTASDSYAVIDGNNNWELEAYLLYHEFQEYNITEATVSLIGEESSSTRNVSNCESFVCYAENNYENVELEEVPGLVIPDLDDYIQDVVCGVDQCGVETYGIMINSICGNTSADLDYFMNYHADQEQRVQLYVMHDEVTNEPIKLFFKQTVPDEGCITIGQDPYAFQDVFFDLICLIYNGITENDHFLNNKSAPVHFSSGATTLFDDNTYSALSSFTKTKNLFGATVTTSQTDGFAVLNYHYGKRLNVENFDHLSDVHWRTNVSFDLDGCSKWTYSFQDVSVLEIPYYDCSEPLYIVIPNNDFDAFRSLFNDPAQIITNEINSGSSEIYERVPHCIAFPCDILQTAIPENCQGQPLDNYFEIIEHVFRTSDNADEIIECLRDNQMIYHYQCNPGLKRERDFYKLVIKKFYESNSDDQDPTMSDIILDGERFLFVFGDHFDNTFRPDYVKTYHKVQEVFRRYYPGRQDFNYLDPYGVKVEKEFNFINDIYDQKTGEKNDKGELIDLKVPGVYIPYAVDKWDENENQEDIDLLIEVGSVALTIAGFPGPALFARLNTFQKAIQVFDLTKSIGGFVIEQGLCECSIGELDVSNAEAAAIKEFCKKWKVFSTAADFALMANGLKEALNDKKKMRESFSMLSEETKNQWDDAVKKKLGNGIGNTEINTAKHLYKGITDLAELIGVFRKAYPHLDNPNYASMFLPNPPGEIYRIAQAHFSGKIDASQLLDADVARHLQNWSGNPANISEDLVTTKQFFDRIQNSIQPNSRAPRLGFQLQDLTPEIFDVWNLIKNRPNLSMDMNVLKSLNNVRKNSTLVAFLQSKYLPDGYLEFFRQLTSGSISRGHALSSPWKKPWANLILDELNKFSNKYNNSTGFAKVVTDLTTSNTKAIGAYWAMEFANSRTLINAKFESGVSVGKYAVDIVADITSDPNGPKKYYELKSWGDNYMTLSKGAGFASQFFNYVDEAQWATMDLVEYHFRRSSSGYNRWTPMLSDFEQFLEDFEGHLDLVNLPNYAQFFGFSLPEITQIQTASNGLEKLREKIALRYNNIFK